MTQNNYPEGLDELVERLSLKYAWAAEFARALLDAMAERGYVLVDAKKQEPVAWGAFYFGGKYDGKPYSILETKEQIDGYIANVHQSDDSTTLRAAPLYTHPAIPGRVALPDGWKVIGEVIGCFDAAFAEGLQEALAETQDERLKDLVERRLMHALYAAQEAAPNPPTQPQGDGSLRLEAE